MSLDIPVLSSFGRRIMIVGPTNAGKSTLAVAIEQKLGIPALHVDLLRHAPHTDWVPRPDEEFHALHARAIAEPEWVMDGNYSDIMPPRLKLATGIVALDDALWRRYWRYFKRTLNHRRSGALEGNQDSIKWAMIEWLWKTRHSAGSAGALSCLGTHLTFGLMRLKRMRLSAALSTASSGV